MTYYDDDDDYYFEPSAADLVLEEFADKLKETLVESVKLEIESINKENERLREENEKLKNNERNVQSKERELKSKEDNLERQFYSKKFSDLLSPYLEKSVYYCVDNKWKRIKKCKECNKDRKIIYKSDNGKTIEKDCECNQRISYYAPEVAELKRFNLWKDKYNRKFVITPKFENRNDDDDRWSNLELKKVVDKFDVSEAESIRRYETVFISKEECQLYCAWLNAKKDI